MPKTPVARTCRAELPQRSASSSAWVIVVDQVVPFHRWTWPFRLSPSLRSFDDVPQIACRSVGAILPPKSTTDQAAPSQCRRLLPETAYRSFGAKPRKSATKPIGGVGTAPKAVPSKWSMIWLPAHTSSGAKAHTAVTPKVPGEAWGRHVPPPPPPPHPSTAASAAAPIVEIRIAPDRTPGRRARACADRVSLDETPAYVVGIGLTCRFKG